jgi:proline iminopeptidase
MQVARSVVSLAAAMAFGACAATPEADLVRTEGHATMDDGVQLNYRVVGNGPTTVIVPMAIYVEDAMAPLADASRRLVFYDPRHRGRSGRGVLDSVSLDRQLRDLDQLRVHLGADSVALIGWSGLGMEMAAYAIRYRGRVTRLVQVSAVPPAAAIMREAGDTRATRTDTAAIRALDARYDAGEFQRESVRYCRERNALMLPGNLYDLNLQDYVPDVCAFDNELPGNLWPYFGKLLGSFGDYDWRPALDSLSIPRLVIHGREDGVPMAGAEAWARYPTARLLVFDSTAHFPFIERRDAFRAAVTEFLAGRWPAGAIQLPNARVSRNRGTATNAGRE